MKLLLSLRQLSSVASGLEVNFVRQLNPDVSGFKRQKAGRYIDKQTFSSSISEKKPRSASCGLRDLVKWLDTV